MQCPQPEAHMIPNVGNQVPIFGEEREGRREWGAAWHPARTSLLYPLQLEQNKETTTPSVFPADPKHSTVFSLNVEWSMVFEARQDKMSLQGKVGGKAVLPNPTRCLQVSTRWKDSSPQGDF